MSEFKVGDKVIYSAIKGTEFEKYWPAVVIVVNGDQLTFVYVDGKIGTNIESDLSGYEIYVDPRDTRIAGLEVNNNHLSVELGKSLVERDSLRLRVEELEADRAFIRKELYVANDERDELKARVEELEAISSGAELINLRTQLAGVTAELESTKSNLCVEQASHRQTYRAMQGYEAKLATIKRLLRELLK